MSPGEERLNALNELLKSCLSAGELPGANASMAGIARSAAARLRQHGLVGAIFERLKKDLSL